MLDLTVLDDLINNTIEYSGFYLEDRLFTEELNIISLTLGNLIIKLDNLTSVYRKHLNILECWIKNEENSADYRYVRFEEIKNKMDDYMDRVYECKTDCVCLQETIKDYLLIKDCVKYAEYTKIDLARFNDRGVAKNLSNLEAVYNQYSGIYRRISIINEDYIYIVGRCYSAYVTKEDEEWCLKESHM